MPLTKTLQQEIDTVLETVLLMAPKKATLRDLAKRAYDSDPKPFDDAKGTWMMDRIEWMIARKRQQVRSIDPDDDKQFMLPGFERIPHRLTMRSGKRIALRNAILSQVREYRAALLAQLTTHRNTLASKDPAQDPRILALDRLIDMMMEHAKQGKTVTVADVMNSERKKQEWRP